MKTRILMFVTLFSGLSLWAAQPQNEDLNFIRRHMQNQKAAELAQTLKISQEQRQQLQTYKNKVDTVLAEHKQKRDALQAKMSTTAAVLRGKLENGADLSETDKQLLKDYRMQMKNLRQERRLNLRSALIGIDQVLTAEQKQQVRTLTETRQKEHRGRKAMQAKAARKWVRLILSDGFLNS